MTKITFNSNIPWKITKTEHGLYVGTCARLGLTAEGYNYNDLILRLHDIMFLFFKDLYKNNQLNDYAFTHSIAYRIDEFFDEIVEVTPSPIIIE